MTPTYLIAALAATAQPAAPCDLPKDLKRPGRVITTSDLDAARACRLATSAESPQGPPASRKTRGRPEDAMPVVDREAEERDWRARWLSVDQRVRRLRRDASELRAEANDAPLDPKKRPTGRRSPSALVRRAEALEREANELESRFDEEARRARALPGWLRPERR